MNKRVNGTMHYFQQTDKVCEATPSGKWPRLYRWINHFDHPFNNLTPIQPCITSLYASLWFYQVFSVSTCTYRSNSHNCRCSSSLLIITWPLFWDLYIKKHTLRTLTGSLSVHLVYKLLNCISGADDLWATTIDKHQREDYTWRLLRSIASCTA